jgi:hypothetical protein
LLLPVLKIEDRRLCFEHRRVKIRRKEEEKEGRREGRKNKKTKEDQRRNEKGHK